MVKRNRDKDLDLKRDMIRLELERISGAILNAINTRDFSLESPAWRHMAPNFRANPDYPLRQKHEPEVEVSLHDFLLMAGRFMTRMKPHQKVELVAISAEIERLGQARVFLKTHLSGEENNEFCIHHVTCLQFVHDQELDKWICVRESGMRGFG